MSGNETFGLAHTRVPTQNSFGKFQLFLGRFYPEQNLGVPNLEQILRDPGLDFRMQIEQANRICDRSPAAADFERNVLLSHSEFLSQTGIALRFFDWIQIGPLEVLDQRNLKYFQVARRPDDDWNFGEPDLLSRTPASFARDQFVAPVDPADNERLNNSVLSNRIDQFL